ncbi:MAG: hypothetical protein K2Y23_01380 [Cyanobacteria bacterium]|nr:hypothetical protein [Cyanobacteriota bacterium]
MSDPRAAAGPRSADDQGVAHALLRVLAPSPIAPARGTPRRPLSSLLSLYRSRAESFNARASGNRRAGWAVVVAAVDHHG